MKAKELKDRSFVTNKNYAGDHIAGKYVFTEEEMVIFCSQLCKEQRELCKDHGFKKVARLVTYGTNEVSPSDIKYAIKNAPEPDIE